MDFPLRCQNCQGENWIDLESPQVRSLDSLTVMEWYSCKFCEGVIPFFFYSRLMEDALTKLKCINPSNPSFIYHLRKLIKRSLEIRVKYGSIQHLH